MYSCSHVASLAEKASMQMRNKKKVLIKSFILYRLKKHTNKEKGITHPMHP